MKISVLLLFSVYLTLFVILKSKSDLFGYLHNFFPDYKASLFKSYTLAGTGEKGYRNGPFLNATFNDLKEIGYGPLRIWFYFTDGNQVRKFNRIKGEIELLAGHKDNKPGDQDGTGDKAYFNNPVGLTVDIFSNVYIVDRGNKKIKKISPYGQVTTIVEKLIDPHSITLFGIYGFITDGNQIKYFPYFTQNKNMDVTVFAGTKDAGYVDGTTAVSKFGKLLSIKNDGSHLFVIDQGNAKIRYLSFVNSLIPSLGGVTHSFQGGGFFKPTIHDLGIVWVSNKGHTNALFSRVSGFFWVTDPKNNQLIGNWKKNYLDYGLILGNGKPKSVDSTQSIWFSEPKPENQTISFNEPRGMTILWDNYVLFDYHSIFVLEGKGNKIRVVDYVSWISIFASLVGGLVFWCCCCVGCCLIIVYLINFIIQIIAMKKRKNNNYNYQRVNNNVNMV